MERAAIFVRGRVQGVGFRWWIRARALEPDAGLLSHLANAIGRDARWVFSEATPVLLTPLNRPEPRATRMILHLLVHIAFWLLLVLMLRL